MQKAFGRVLSVVLRQFSLLPVAAGLLVGVGRPAAPSRVFCAAGSTASAISIPAAYLICDRRVPRSATWLGCRRPKGPCVSIRSAPCVTSNSPLRRLAYNIHRGTACFDGLSEYWLCAA